MAFSSNRRQTFIFLAARHPFLALSPGSSGVVFTLALADLFALLPVFGVFRHASCSAGGSTAAFFRHLPDRPRPSASQRGSHHQTLTMQIHLPVYRFGFPASAAQFIATVFVTILTVARSAGGSGGALPNDR